MPQSVPRRSNADHVGGESVVELRPLAQRQPDLNGVSRLGRPQSIVREEHASNAVCWAPGERLNHLLEEACIRFATNDAVIGSGIVLSYRDLNRRANQLARHLLARGIKSGRPRRNDVRQIARNIRGDACGDESQCGLCATRRRLSD